MTLYRGFDHGFEYLYFVANISCKRQRQSVIRIIKIRNHGVIRITHSVEFYQTIIASLVFRWSRQLSTWSVNELEN